LSGKVRLQNAKSHVECDVKPYYRVRTDPGKVWKVLEFNVDIFKALKSHESDRRYGKVWKTP